jgi:hypothetical protein
MDFNGGGDFNPTPPPADEGSGNESAQDEPGQADEAN